MPTRPSIASRLAASSLATGLLFPPAFAADDGDPEFADTQ